MQRLRSRGTLATEEEKRRKDPVNHINVNSTTARVLKQMGTVEMFKPPPSMQPKEPADAAAGSASAALPEAQAYFRTGRVAASFTSTAVPVAATDEVRAPCPASAHSWGGRSAHRLGRLTALRCAAQAARWHEDDVMYERIKKKAYVRLHTNLGPLSLELHSDLVRRPRRPAADERRARYSPGAWIGCGRMSGWQAPMTVHNFILLCKRGYYNNVQFHRNIKAFMVRP